MPDLPYIESIWYGLANKYCKDRDLLKELFIGIQNAYNEPKRFYHNLDHIEYLLRLSASFSDQITDKDAVNFSIFYHDYVYVTGKGDNEFQSAQVAQKALNQLGLSKSFIDRVQLYINTTSNNSNLLATDEDLRFFIDFDLSILAADREVYKNYILNIRKEYSQIATTQFTLGRKGFIQHLLSQQHIFYTQQFREKEEQARKNMQWELEMSPGIFSAG
jgi:predicted metal-dependent HD superfamily phosphohydrolase